MENVTEGVTVPQTSKPGFSSNSYSPVELPFAPESSSKTCADFFLTAQWDGSKETLEMTGAMPPTPVITSTL